MKLLDHLDVTPSSFLNKDVLTWLDFTQEDISKLLARAQQLKEHPHSSILNGKTLAMLFEKSSTRTRVSFEVGMTQLGGHAINLHPRDLQLGRGETIADTANVLSGYVDAIMYRSSSHHKLKELAQHSRVPVINGLCDTFHPCQALADLFTVLELKGKLSNVKIVYLGDGNNVSHSLMVCAALMGLDIVVSTPKGFEPDPNITEKAKHLAQTSNGSVAIDHNPERAAEGADIVYTDVWKSMGQEEDHTRYSKLQPYQANEALMKSAKPDAHFMHCLPAHRGEEVTAGVIDGPKSVVFQQAENRLHVQKAMLQSIIPTS
ncbi:ornithine carbamoyltransferase [Thalassobacillus sp. CUG 92003]|uniref:ornithine carbamoyltransferase n=1 Tax=Thalassobacillus sp. CUG 92003 TaxID=2736641 RepID=UPI0015E7C93A|nr:ornithine carbamoyltransferase [Thalassobacillus sp. CUG 92003]